MQKRLENYLLGAIIVVLVAYSAFFYSIFNINDGNISLSPENSQGTCNDGDGGYYPTTASRVESMNYNYGEMIAFDDSCIDSDTVLEYSCDANYTYSARIYTCRNGCSEGACSAIRKSFLLRATNFFNDLSLNYTTIQEDFESGWIEKCSDRKKGDSCYIDEVILVVDDVSAGADKWARFHYGNAGKSFRPTYDEFRNRIYLPISSEVPAASMTFAVTEPDGAVIRSINLSWANSAINVSQRILIPDKQTSFVFYSSGNAVFVNVTMAHGPVSFPVLYGDGSRFTGIGRDSARLLATSDDYNLFYNDTRGDSMFVLSLGTGGNNGSTCSTSFKANITDCRPDERIVKYFMANSTCGIKAPDNITLERCDYNNNKIIGNLSDIDSNFNFTFYDNSLPINMGNNFSGVHSLSMNEGGNVRVEFDFNFSSSSLDMTRVFIRRQANSSNEGYIIINGLNGVNKNVYVDKVKNFSNSVCIKESSITNIGSISDSCSSSNERLISCNNIQDSGYTCQDLGNFYFVTGLNHSAVMEFDESIFSGSQSCTPSWSCGEWSECIAGEQTRLCTDLNSCQSIANKPAEAQSCSEQTFGSNDRDPDNINPISEDSGGKIYFWVIIVIMSFAILTVIALIVISISKRRMQNKSL